MGQGLNGPESGRNASLTQITIRLIQERKPKNLRQLVNFVKQETFLPEQEIIKHIMLLQTQGMIRLKEPSATTSKGLTNYLSTREARWYWITLVIAVTTTITSFTLSEDTYPAVYIRYLLGTVFVTWMPGYTVMKALFPREPPFKTSSRDLESVERIVLSVGMSWALVPLLVLLLNFTSSGINLSTIVVGLVTITIVFATIGIIRERQSYLENTPRSS